MWNIKIFITCLLTVVCVDATAAAPTPTAAQITRVAEDATFDLTNKLVEALKPVTPVKPVTSYNILSIDGGGMKAMIPAYVIEKMEEYAYTKLEETYS